MAYNLNEPFNMRQTAASPIREPRTSYLSGKLLNCLRKLLEGEREANTRSPIINSFQDGQTRHRRLRQKENALIN